MVKGKQIQPKVFAEKTVTNYRKLDALNFSMIKLFDTDPVKFYEEFKLGKARKDRKNAALIIGDIVDFYILECKGDDLIFQDRMDEKFALFEGTKGSGQVFILADYIFEEASSSLNAEGEVTLNFATMFTTAYDKIKAEDKYKGKDEVAVMDDFVKKGKAYYDTLMANIGKTVVETSLVDKAKNVANKLLKDEFTKGIFTPRADIEYFTHFGIAWTYPGTKTECKSEIDMLFIDHEKGAIQPMDLKTTYDNESFDMMYVKNSYYLQNAFYSKAVREWADANGMEGFDVLPMRFVVGDTSANNRRPLVYNTTLEDGQCGLFGFTFRGNYYRGVDELVREIIWAEENGVWDCSRAAFVNQGRMKLNIKYE